MSRYFNIGIILLSIFFISIEYSLADCDFIGNNPSGGEIIVCDTDPPNPETTAVNTGNNNDDITVQAGAGINAPGDAIKTEDGNDTVVVNNGNTAQDVVIGSQNAIETDDGNDTVTVNGGLVQGNNDTIHTEGGNDRVTANGTNIIGNNHGIRTGDGMDEVTVNGGSINSGSNGINTEEDDDIVNVGLFGLQPAVIISSGQNAIRTGSGNDRVTVIGATLVGDPNDGIFTAGDNDTVIIEDASVTSTNNHPVHSGSGNDMVTLRGGELIAQNPASFSVRLNTGDDTVRIERQTSLTGLMNGEEGFDTLIFALIIPAVSECEAVKGQIPQLTGNDSINILGFTYSWINFESIVDEINCAEPVVRSIPTLSQWSLIVMAAITGMVGWIAMRRRPLHR